jgi:hypothetical protein
VRSGECPPPLMSNSAGVFGATKEKFVARNSVTAKGTSSTALSLLHRRHWTVTAVGYGLLLHHCTAVGF